MMTQALKSIKMYDRVWLNKKIPLDRRLRICNALARRVARLCYQEGRPPCRN